MDGKNKNLEGMGGGIGPALTHNPNATVELGDAPDGPLPHLLGMTADGGMHGDDSVKSKGIAFHFK